MDGQMTFLAEYMDTAYLEIYIQYKLHFSSYSDVDAATLVLFQTLFYKLIFYSIMVDRYSAFKA